VVYRQNKSLYSFIGGTSVSEPHFRVCGLASTRKQIQL